MERKLPKYDAPPLEEVVFGVTFEPPSAFKAPHLGLFWGELRSEFPRFEQASVIAPIDSLIETETGFPLPRIWLINTNDDKLIQLQKNKFLFNWRKRAAPYPHFETTFAEFKGFFERFKEFATKDLACSLSLAGFELSYINHLPQDQAWNDFHSLGRLFPDFTWRDDVDRYLRPLESFSWQLRLPLAETSGTLLVNLRPGVRNVDQKPVLLFELNARSLGNDAAENDLDSWFVAARRAIVLTFEELTSDKVQRDLWRKRP